MVHRIRLAAEAARNRARRATVGGPHGLAIGIDVNAVGAAPGPRVNLRPMQDHAVRILAAVDGLHFVGLRSAAALRRLAPAAGPLSLGLSLYLLPADAARQQRQPNNKQRTR